VTTRVKVDAGNSLTRLGICGDELTKLPCSNVAACARLGAYLVYRVRMTTVDLLQKRVHGR
jgi:hypothetical protein